MEEEIKNFTVYKSSAGSGKTTTLVMEYLRLAIPNPDGFKEIVGITFTIKATNEMKSRVMETLEKIINSGGDFDSISSLIYHEVMLTHGFTKEIFMEKAHQLLRNILHSYSNFAFSTIDSFVVKIVKSFAFDLKLPLNFDIELDTNVIIDEAVSALISQAGYDDRLTNNLLKYIEHQADEESDTRIHILIAELTKVLFNDSFSEFQKTIGAIDLSELNTFANLIIKRRRVLFERIKQLGSEAIEMIQRHNIDYKDFYFGNSGGIPAYFTYLKKGNISKMMPGKRLQQSMVDEKWFAGKCPLAIQSEILSIAEELADLFEEVQQLIPEFLGLHFLRNNIEAVLLLGEVNQEIQNYYQENSVIHLSETVKRVAEVVNKEQMPFIYERIGAKYKHFLIDEFQDTSIAQWKNLVPLIDNSLSEGNYNLVVGDAKQSIYRWRGGDFEQFVGLPHLVSSEEDTLIRERELNLSRNFKEVVLGNNYRSYTSIVDFNNNYYDFVKNNSNEIIQRVFEFHHQEYFQKKSGYVELNFLPKHQLEEEEFQSKIISIIRDLEARHFSFGDLTILARTNNQLSYLADFLLNEEIPIISSNSLRIFSSIHIRFIVNFIRWIADKEDKISRTAILFYWHEEGHITTEQFNEFISTKSNTSIIDFIFNTKDKTGDLSTTNDVALIIEFLSHRFGLFDKDYAFIIQLLNFTKTAELHEGQGYMNFLEYVEKKGNDEFLSMPDEINAVNLMTIHKAKGLEFPVVIWIDFYSGGKKNGYLSVDLKSIGVKKPQNMLILDNKLLGNSVFKSEKENSERLTEADHINVAYVATTRPQKELYIVAEEKSIHYNNLKSFVEYSTDFIADEDQDCFRLGEKILLEPIVTNTSETEMLFNKNFIPWNQRISMRKSYMEGNQNFEGEEVKKEGLRIHALLSKINTATDIDSLLENEITAGKLRTDEYSALKTQLQNIVDTKEIAPYFDSSWEVLNERAIISSEQTTFRPDRVLVKGTKVVVIDYKLSDYTNISDLQKHRYFTQVKNYVTLLKEIYPNKTIVGYLLWLKGTVYLEKVL